MVLSPTPNTPHPFSRFSHLESWEKVGGASEGKEEVQVTVEDQNLQIDDDGNGDHSDNIHDGQVALVDQWWCEW